MNNTREDVIAALLSAFSGERQATAMEILDLYGTEPHERERDRVQLAILKLSDGDENKLLHFVDAAKEDYRDVLSWAESAEPPCTDERVNEARHTGPGRILPETAKEELETRVRQSGTAIADMALAQGVRAMLDFYRDVRTEGCELEEDGDMLLFEWGAGDAGSARSFQCGIIRQFSLAELEEDDSRMSQLLLTFHYSASPGLDALKNGNYWCSVPDDLADFEALITGSDVYSAVNALRPSKVTLEYDED